MTFNDVKICLEKGKIWLLNKNNHVIYLHNPKIECDFIIYINKNLLLQIRSYKLVRASLQTATINTH